MRPQMPFLQPTLKPDVGCKPLNSVLIFIRDVQERDQRKQPLYYPPNSRKESRIRLGCIRRNPTKGIESMNLGCSHKGHLSLTTEVAFEEIPQRELRVFGLPPAGWVFERLLHSKKSHKGNWESFWKKSSDLTTAICCIRRNPTKGIESL